MFLSATTQSLEIDLNGAVAANQLPVTFSYVDVDQTTFAMSAMTMGSTQTNSTTAVTIVSGTAGQTRQIKYLCIKNSDTSPVLLWVQLNDNSTLREQTKCTLAVNDSLIYTDTDGWKTLDANGAAKYSQSGVAVASGKTLTVNDSTTIATNSVTFGGAGVLTLTAAKNVTFADAFATSGANPLILTTSGSTNVTLPTSGTLATTAQLIGGSWASPGAAIGTGTPVAGTFTTLTASGRIFANGLASSSFDANTKGIEGAGSTSAWSIVAGGDLTNALNISMNAYYASGAWTYGAAATGATNYYQNAGTHNWRVGSGASGAITWIDSLSIANTGAISTNNQPLSTGSGAISGGAISGTGFSTSTVAGIILDFNVGTTSGKQIIRGGNTGGTTALFTESSTGGTFTSGSAAYSAVFGSQSNTSLHLIANNVIGLTLNPTGNAVSIPSLAGSGSRPVMVDANGVLSAP